MSRFPGLRDRYPMLTDEEVSWIDREDAPGFGLAYPKREGRPDLQDIVEMEMNRLDAIKSSRKEKWGRTA